MDCSQVRKDVATDLPKVFFDVDWAYCISLDRRADRRQLFEETVAKRISNRIEVFIARRHDNPVQGCYESHQALARLALLEGWRRVLIFEDDAKPYEISEAQVRWINRFIRESDFQILHLGYTMGRTWLTWFPFIARGKVVALHAYILSRKGCQILADAPYNGAPVDVFIKRQMKQHCVFPMLFRQHAAKDTGSDILEVATNGDAWWERNWKKHRRSLIKNLWRTVLRLRF